MLIHSHSTTIVYANHRPIEAISIDDITVAFHALGAEPVSGIIPKDNFFNKLMVMGEKMSEKELNHCLSTLIGEDVTMDSLEDQFTGQAFAEHLLGFASKESPGEQGNQQQ